LRLIYPTHTSGCLSHSASSMARGLTSIFESALRPRFTSRFSNSATDKRELLIGYSSVSDVEESAATTSRCPAAAGASVPSPAGQSPSISALVRRRTSACSRIACRPSVFKSTTVLLHDSPRFGVREISNVVLWHVYPRYLWNNPGITHPLPPTVTLPTKSNQVLLGVPFGRIIYITHLLKVVNVECFAP